VASRDPIPTQAVNVGRVGRDLTCGSGKLAVGISHAVTPDLGSWGPVGFETMDGLRGAITTVRLLGCGGPPTTHSEPLRGGGAVERDRAGGLVPDPHKYFYVAGRPTLFESLWSGGGSEGIARGACAGTWTAVCVPRTQNDMGRGGVVGALGSPFTSCAAHSGRLNVRHHPQCHSVGVRRPSRDHAVPCWLPHSVCGAGGGPPLHTGPLEGGQLGPILLGPRCRTVPAPDPSTSRPSFWRVRPLRSSSAPYYLVALFLLHDVPASPTRSLSSTWDARSSYPLHFVCYPTTSMTPTLVCRAPPPPARARPWPTSPLLVWKLPRRGCPALPHCWPRTMAPSLALWCQPTWACCC